MTIRTYCRRSKNDEGKQQFSLDVQAANCADFIDRMNFAPQTRVAHVDDGRAGDDFHTRAGLRELLADAKRGDIIVCRDQSRLGRDAIEVTLVVRDLVRDRGCRLFYYTTVSVSALFDGMAVAVFDGSRSRSRTRLRRSGMGIGNQRAIT